MDKFRKRVLIISSVFVVLLIVALILYNSTGFFQFAKIDSKDLESWDYVNGSISGSNAFILNGTSNVCWLMIHSYVATPAEFTELANEVNVKFNDSVYVPLLSGHGQVPSKIIGKDLDIWYSESENYLLELQTKCEKINLVGSSFGGSLTLKLAQQHNISHLYLVNAFVDKSSSWYVIVPFELRLSLGSPWLYYSKKSQVAQINDPEGLKKHIAYWTMPYQPVLDSLPFLKQLRKDAFLVSCPTLAIHSKNDHVADFKKLKETFTELSSVDKEFIELTKSNHVLLMDYDKSEVIKSIIDFEELRR